MFIGDIHGNFSGLTLKMTYIRNYHVFQVGDFNIGFRSIKRDYDELFAMNDLCVDLNNHLYIIRGNHDSPFFFSTTDVLIEHIIEKMNYESYLTHEERVQNIDYAKKIKELSNVHFVEDYSVVKINDVNILCVGGAISIDRKKQMLVNKWFQGEKINYDLSKVIGIKDVDIVVTHSAPSFCYPTKFNGLVYEYASKDQSLYDELKEERYYLSNVHSQIENERLTHWFYGHFHSYHRELINNTEFILLDIDEAVTLNK